MSRDRTVPRHGACPAGWHNPLRDKRDKRMPRIAGPCGVVIFGVTGDLSRKKLMPAIYDLANRGLLPPSFALVGFARRDWADQDFGEIVYDAVKEHARTPFRQEVWDRLAEGIRFVQGSFDDDAVLRNAGRDPGEARRRARHRRQSRVLPVHPTERLPGGLRAAEALRTGRLRRAAAGAGWSSRSRSATTCRAPCELNAVVNSVFPEESVFRIDHYLGKETVQNILALRFANELYEPIWNSHYVDSVQITMAEDIGLGGRAGYYDGIGAARDVIQNHLLQLLALTAMEEPVSFHPEEVKAEKIKVLAATRLAQPLDLTTSRGQYAAGWQGGEQVVGLLDEDGFSTDLHHRDLRRDRRSTSTPGGGRAFRSTCAPENGWAAG